MSLTELETAALANNPEIRVATRRVAIAETRVRSAGSLSDPEFMYRGWGFADTENIQTNLVSELKLFE
jgi:outer membrane protein, heavy metal efflux system